MLPQYDGGKGIPEQNPQKVAFEHALALLQRGDVQAAQDACSEALAHFPDDANMLCLSARALCRLRRYDDADKLLRDALALFPDFARPYEVLGEIALARQQPEKAVDALRRAIHIGTDSSDSYEMLATALNTIGRDEEAQKVIREYRRQNPIAVLLAEALAHERSGDLDAADEGYQGILLRDPDNVEAVRRIGSVAAAKKQYVDAELFLRRAVQLAPDYSGAWADLVVVQMEAEKYDDAIVSAEYLLRLDADNATSRLMLANAYAMSGRYADALANYQVVVNSIPGQPGALSGIGHMLKTIGRSDESIAAYKECIHCNPQHTEAWWGLANMKTYQFSHDEIEAMLHLLHKGEPQAVPTSRWLTSTPEVNLCNALAMAFERSGDYDRAFEYLERGNKKRRLDESYDPVQTEHLHDRIISVFGREFLESKSGPGCQDDAAIFIVGLPRTGSTLIEQILASHGQVDGTYELPDLGQLIRELPIFHFDRSDYPENVIDLSDDMLAALGSDYIERTRKYRSGNAFFTDKNLSNFLHIGLLQLILPNAKFINAKRHPLDTCLGTYKQLFARGISFSYELEELGEYFLQYQRLMDHWDAVLPGKVLHVKYEDVVADLESQTHRILDHCGLPWDEKCLQFHENKRDVRTASSEQVRQPIYSSSVHLWRHYEANLGELIAIIEPELRKLPEEDQPATCRDRNVT